MFSLPRTERSYGLVSHIYTRRIVGWVSLNLPGSGKEASTSPAPHAHQFLNNSSIDNRCFVVQHAVVIFWYACRWDFCFVLFCFVPWVIIIVILISFSFFLLESQRLKKQKTRVVGVPSTRIGNTLSTVVVVEVQPTSLLRLLAQVKARKNESDTYTPEKNPMGPLGMYTTGRPGGVSGYPRAWYRSAS